MVGALVQGLKFQGELLSLFLYHCWCCFVNGLQFERALPKVPLFPHTTLVRQDQITQAYIHLKKQLSVFNIALLDVIRQSFCNPKEFIFVFPRAISSSLTNKVLTQTNKQKKNLVISCPC